MADHRSAGARAQHAATQLAGPYAARHRALDRLDALTRTRLVGAVLDDPDWQTAWDLSEARQLADRGATVIAALTHDRLLQRADDAYVLDANTALADLVVELRHDGINARGRLEAGPEPARATITVLRNRRGQIRLPGGIPWPPSGLLRP